MFLETRIRPKTGAFSTKQHLLLIDDEPAIRALAILELENRGYRVTGAADSDEALLWLDNISISLVILDLNLPRIDGLTLLPIIKKRQPALPVLILTGARFDENTAKEAMRKGADGFISKGVGVQELFSEIRRFLH